MKGWVALWLPAACVLCALTARAAEPDYTRYQRLLDDYLHVVSKPGEPIETRFDYVGLDSQAGAAERMARIAHALLAVDPDSMNDKQRTAWAINLYNFRTIDLVIRNLHDPRSRKFIASVRDVAFSFGQDFFEQPGLRVRDTSYTLNGFERKFLFRGFDRSPGTARPKDLDPRIHFAIVCASVGCPPLMPRAYRGDSLDSQLDFAVRNALASPRHLRWSAAGRPFTSQLFRWYVRDFEPEGPVAFIERYAPPAVGRAMRERGISILDQDIPWDWSLNRYVPGAY